MDDPLKRFEETLSKIKPALARLCMVLASGKPYSQQLDDTGCLCVAYANARDDAVKLTRALVALYTFPGVRELLAPKESLGSIAAQVERTLEEVGQ